MGGDSDRSVSEITALTGGGAHRALDTTAVPHIVAAAIDALRPTGTIGLVGGRHSRSWARALGAGGGQDHHGHPRGGRRPPALPPPAHHPWRQGRFPFGRLITHYPLEDIDRADQDVAPGITVKPVLVPGKG